LSLQQSKNASNIHKKFIISLYSLLKGTGTKENKALKDHSRWDTRDKDPKTLFQRYSSKGNNNLFGKYRLYLFGSF